MSARAAATRVATTARAAQASRLTAPPARAVGLSVATALCALAIAAGLWHRDALEISPRDGLGYALGIVGLACMGTLLLYSLRKRARPLHGAGPIRHWFHAHMILGVVGPTAILFHSGFRAESQNGGVALAAMLLVAGSGFVGRVLYTRVHAGLFGHRQSLRDVSERAAASREDLAGALARAPVLLATLRELEAQALGPAARSPLASLALAVRLRFAQRPLLRAARRDPALADPLRRHLALVRRAASFAFYERVLSLWHALHLPLCIVLFAAAALHVFAVHRF